MHSVTLEIIKSLKLTCSFQKIQNYVVCSEVIFKIKNWGRKKIPSKCSGFEIYTMLYVLILYTFLK